jgi:dipeptidyl aminopeptidase/acylaminoacyl peptidase
MWALAACLEALIALSASADAASAQPRDSLPIAAALSQPSFPEFMPLSLAPDGHAVAYTTCIPASATRDTLIGRFTRAGTPPSALACSVWVAGVANRGSVRLGGGDGVNAWAPQWSPDGTTIAFYADQDGVARLWVWNAETSTTRAVSDAIVRPYTPLEGPRWTPDSRGVVTRVLPPGMTLESAVATTHPAGASWDTTDRKPGSTVLIYRTDSVWRSRPRQIPSTVSGSEVLYDGDLALIRIATGEVQTLAHGYRPFAYWVSPDGRFAAFTSLHGITSPTSTAVEYQYDLLAASLDGRNRASPTLIADRVVISPFGSGVAWSPTGTAFVYATTDTDGSDRYHIVHATDWAARLLPVPDDIRHALSGRSGAQALRWNAAGNSLFVAADAVIARLSVNDGHCRVLSRAPHGTSIITLIGPNTRSSAWETGGSSLVVESRNDSTRQMGFAAVNLRTGAWTQLTNEDQYIGSKISNSSDVATNGRTFVYVSESATRPPDLWSTRSNLTGARQITSIAPTVSDRRYGTTRLLRWHTANGDEINGALLLPLGYEPSRRYPLIVYPYPRDDRSTDVFRFGLEGAGTENMQLFATRGFAVLVPDAPIRVIDQMRSLADVVLPGVDQVIAIGIADSNRVGVMGHSWGGYTVLALLVQTQRFRAAVMRGGYGDLFAVYGEMQPTGSTFGQLLLESSLGGSPWHDLPRYIDNSPVFFLDRVRTPLLIVEGGAETTVPPYEAAEIFVDLRRLGQEVEYALYEGENHGEVVWRLANQRDYLARILQWFDVHLASVAIAR